MGRKKISISILNMNAKYKEGRGQGEGKDYRPWLYVRDFSSAGLTSEIKGWTTKRVHQLFSQGERSYFLILDWNDDVTDIREQVPLFDDPAPCIHTTLTLAEQLGYRHPAITSSRIPVVMTTDFLITRTVHGVPCLEARAYKMSKDLSDHRVLEKLEIERLYWERQGVEWKIVTEKSINRVKVQNIEMIRLPELFFIHNGITLDLSNRIGKEYLENDIYCEMPLCDACMKIDDRFSLQIGTSILAVKYLLSTKQWEVDMNIPFKTIKPLKLIHVRKG